MIEQCLFHPVAMSRDLGDAPLAVQLLETPVVIWRAADGQVRAFADRCPHRGAALSMGRIVDDTLECPYHGWRFNAGGRCTHVPAVPQFNPPATYTAETYTAREAYGLIWVALTTPDKLDAQAMPAFVAEDDEHLRKVTAGPFEVSASAPRIVENFLDMSHFGFVHEGWLGSRDTVSMEPYKVQSTPTGFLATECFAWQPQSNIHSETGAMVEYTYEVNAPFTCILTKVPDAKTVKVEAFRESIALFVCPVTPETSRVWIRMAMVDFESPDQKIIDFQNTIFGQDQPVLESQRPKRLPVSEKPPVTELHSAADTASAAYRRYPP